MAKLPAYRRIEAHLRAELPKHQVGDLLPTIADLCEEFDVAGVSTIVNAYRPLVDAGLVTVEYRPSRRWVVARVPEARPENPLDAVRADLEKQVESIRALLAQAETTLAQFNAQTPATTQAPISTSSMKGTMSIEIPETVTPAQEARLRIVLGNCSRQAAQAIQAHGTPAEVLPKDLAAEFESIYVADNGVFGDFLHEGEYVTQAQEVSFEALLKELDLVSRVLDTFAAYRGVVQTAVQKALQEDGEYLIATMGRVHNRRLATGTQST